MMSLKVAAALVKNRSSYGPANAQKSNMIAKNKTSTPTWPEAVQNKKRRSARKLN
eukprot:CAMPEP_0183325072 /NCGR_PEP_ID=MMETSP0160_2-20130417/78719_1 /TAXON_ID=2839 ORGANISM="Odontella Sinensis, Strain Grunow 1884" /NCGR_SAMPLE_ID=MMETSP0160_2 /ASSEMBLY_ACC=CAM_ASM_000250 /LENGTH=54 /DNA_ID=CAMNT_0025492795 /DNA_START=31 /DNA_END=195 /DNA_ORIENTATION=+